MDIKLNNQWEQLRSSYWFVPMLMTLSAIGLSFGTIALDHIVQQAFVEAVGVIWAGGPEGARGLLTTIASSMLGVAGVTFSITIATLSLASSQFGPHLLRNFMRDTSNQIVLGTFIGTFIYCLLVLRTIREGPRPEDEFVPYLSVTLSLVLALVNTGVLIFFIHHVAMSIQAPNVIAAVNSDLERAIDQIFPQMLGQNTPAHMPLEQAIPADFERDACPITATNNGYLQAIDNQTLLDIATTHNLLVRLEHRPGHFIVRSSDLVLAWPAVRVDDDLQQKIRKAFILGRQNTLTQDVEFAINQLVQIAVRALSPGINDPFTALICIDWLGAALCRLADKDLPSPYRVDDDMTLRIITNAITLPNLIDGAFNQIRQNAQSWGMLVVAIRLLETIAMIADHLGDDEEKGAAALLRHSALIMQGIRQNVPDNPDRQEAEKRYQTIIRVLEHRWAMRQPVSLAHTSTNTDIASP